MRALIGCLCVLVAAGCGAVPREPPRTYALGRFDATRPDVLLQRVSAVLVGLGYHPDRFDAVHGVIEVTSRNHVRRAHATFRVQLFGDGWIVVSPGGPDVVQTDVEIWSMPRAYEDEYTSLAAHIRERLDDEELAR